MNKATASIVLAVVMSAVGIAGDYFLKRASQREGPLTTGAFFGGLALYASTAFAWVFVMRHLKLATIGVVYSVSMILLLTMIGTIAFREALRPAEVVGLVMAIISLVLLMRFA